MYVVSSPYYNTSKGMYWPQKVKLFAKEVIIYSKKLMDFTLIFYSLPYTERILGEIKVF